MCDQRKLLATYNRAAAIYEKRTGEKLPRWSQRLVKATSFRAAKTARNLGGGNETTTRIPRALRRSE
jgi:hypothetical protein